MNWRLLILNAAQAGIALFVGLRVGYEICRVVMTMINDGRREEIALEWLGEIAAELWDFAKGCRMDRFV